MSKTLLTFLLTELQTVRVICQRKSCGGIIELPVDKLENAFRQFQCPLCESKIRFSKEDEEDLFDLLGRAIRKFKEPAVKEKIQLEFVLASKSGPVPHTL